MPAEEKQPCVYMMASSRRGTLYTGVTSDLGKRAFQHRTEIADGFTTKHKIHLLVYFQFHSTMEEAIVYEKRIKKWPREYKYNLIEEMNPNWEDLYEKLFVSV